MIDEGLVFDDGLVLVVDDDWLMLVVDNGWLIVVVVDSPTCR